MAVQTADYLIGKINAGDTRTKQFYIDWVDSSVRIIEQNLYGHNHDDLYYRKSQVFTKSESDARYLRADQSPTLQTLSNGAGIVSFSYNGAAAASVALAASGVSAGSYNRVTVDIYGRVVSASNESYAPAGTYVNSFNGRSGTVNPLTGDYHTDMVPELAGATNKWYTDARNQTFSDTRYSQLGHTHAALNNGAGIASFNYTGASPASVALAASGVTAGTYNNVTVDIYGRVTSASNQSYQPAGNYLTSFNGRTASAVVPQSGDYNTTLVPEGTNLYYTNARNQTFSDTRYSQLGHTHSTLSNGVGIASFSYNGGAAASVALAASGVIAGTYNNVTVDIYGRVTSGNNVSYLTTESDTLQTVTSRGSSTTTGISLGAGTYVVDATGNLTRIRNIAYSFPSAQGAAGSQLTNDGAGNLTWAAAGFGTGITSLNGSSAAVQTFAVGTAGTNFNISTAALTGIHTFNIPDASATARGLITTGAQIIAGIKTFNNEMIVGGASNVSQLTIKANASQNAANPIFRLISSTSVELMRLHADLSFNTFAGASAGSSINNGTNNSGFGYNALLQNNTGGYNSAFGTEALRSNNSGTYNSAFGYRALYNNNSGAQNTGIGFQALYNNTNGIDNTAIGWNALYANSSGRANTAVGRDALQANTSGIENTGVGIAALAFNTIGNANAGFGLGALYNNTSASFNTGVGKDVLYTNQTGNNNAIVGYTACAYSTTASGNTAIGSTSLVDLRTGINNTAIGYLANVSANNTSYGIALGYGAVAASNQLAISPNIQTISIPGLSTGAGYVLTDQLGNGNLTLRPINIGNVAWSLTGNSGTSSSTNFIGTTDGASLIFKVNNLKAGQLQPGNATFFGYLAGLNYTGSNGMTGIGRSALENNTTGSGNTAIGDFAMLMNTIGGLNVAVGQLALRSNTSANENTAIGAQALRFSTTGAGNTAIGSLSLFNNLTGGSNIAVGSSSLYDLTSGSRNVVIGYYSGGGITTGSYNTIIGSMVTGLAPDLTNTIILAAGNGEIRLTIDSNGRFILALANYATEAAAAAAGIPINGLYQTNGTVKIRNN